MKLWAATAGGESRAYRREIDGLRAIAVLAVIFYHADFGWFSGGYVGVDVFFVISGYLIFTIIFREKSSGNFSLLRFYERRVRRVFPALFLMLGIAFLLSLLFLYPSQRESFGSAMAAVALFLSNVYFYRNFDYFNPPTVETPLIHTWSLAVEEQFYVLFPLMVLILWRFGQRALLGMFVLGLILSLALSQWAASAYPTAAFYLLPTRAFELLIGILVASQYSTRDFTSISRYLGYLAFVGLGMILFAFWFFGDATPFPGWHALVPTIGGGLIVLGAKRDNLAGRLLGSRPLVFIGLISYSLYLIHLPLFAFARITSLGTPPAIVFVTLTGVAIVLATMSWRFVEQPFRRSGFLSRNRVFALGLVATLVTLGMGSAYREQGADWWSPVFSNFPSGLTESMARAKGFEDCVHHPFCEVVPGSDAPLSYGILGDSHAVSLLPAFQELSETTGSNGLVSWSGGCPPLLGVYPLGRVDQNQQDCRMRNEQFLEIIKSENIPRVFLVAMWTMYNGGGYAGEGFGPLGLAKNDDQDQSTSRHAFVAGLEMTIGRMKLRGSSWSSFSRCQRNFSLHNRSILMRTPLSG
ncbi:MAG: acyltransferase family protein [Chloroflexi bacterium]|nr:acyltransferase family protein [Chloroflexota bacterium]MDA1173390.1 acyltransferase family protein [Chloroflexota bacterium]